MMESEDHYGCGLEELLDQATAVSNSGKKLSLLKNAISIEELNDTKTALFRDSQTAIVQDVPNQNLEAAVEQEILDQPSVHVDEASTSGPLCCRRLSLRFMMC